MTTVLLTGFEPFNGETTNPSWDALALVDVPGVRLATELLPCSFGRSLPALRAAVELHQPDIVVAVGQAGGRAVITPERVAVNGDDARIPDNDGRAPVDEPIVDGAPMAYLTGLPIKAAVTAMREADIPVTISHTAGTFVCNHVFYGLMHMINTELPHIRGGFVHVPFSTAQVAARGTSEPSMSLRTIADGLAVLVQTCVQISDDMKVSGGTLH